MNNHMGSRATADRAGHGGGHALPGRPRAFFPGQQDHPGHRGPADRRPAWGCRCWSATCSWTTRTPPPTSGRRLRARSPRGPGPGQRRAHRSRAERGAGRGAGAPAPGAGARGGGAGRPQRPGGGAARGGHDRAGRGVLLRRVRRRGRGGRPADPQQRGGHPGGAAPALLRGGAGDRLPPAHRDHPAGGRAGPGGGGPGGAPGGRPGGHLPPGADRLAAGGAVLRQGPGPGAGQAFRRRGPRAGAPVRAASGAIDRLPLPGAAGLRRAHADRQGRGLRPHPGPGHDHRRRLRRGLRQGGQALRPGLPGGGGHRPAGPTGQPRGLPLPLAVACTRATTPSTSPTPG